LKFRPTLQVYQDSRSVDTVGTAVLGMALLGEPANALRLGCIALIVGGIVGLKVLH